MSNAQTIRTSGASFTVPFGAMDDAIWEARVSEVDYLREFDFLPTQARWLDDDSYSSQ